METTIFQGQKVFITTAGDAVAGDRLNAVELNGEFRALGAGRIIGLVERTPAGQIVLYPYRMPPLTVPAEARTLASLRVQRSP